MWQRLQTHLRIHLRTHWLWFSGALLCALLVLTAVLQYRWINRVSEADRQQRRALLETTLRNFQGEFDRLQRDSLQFFRGALGVRPGTAWETQLNRTLDEWQRTAERPQLINAIGFASLDKTGAPIFKRRARNATEFSAQAWPEELATYRTLLTKQLRTPAGNLPLAPRGFAQEFVNAQPALVFQLVEDPRPPFAQPELDREETPNRVDRPAAARRIEALLDNLVPDLTAPPRSKPALIGWCVLELDAVYLQTQWLPEQLERYFSQRGMEGFQLALLTGQPPRVLYQAGQAGQAGQARQAEQALSADAFTTADAALPLFARRVQNTQVNPPPPGPPPLRPSGPPRDELPGRPPRGESPDGPPGARRRPPEDLTAFDAAVDPAAWRLVVRDAHGSLEAAIEQARRRNLALAFGVLLILAGSFVLLLLATQRVRRLAAQQLEFVAGVSHELRTPLAVIQSTSHNLAQGVVKDPARVQQYGTAIQTEVRRLSHQLEQVLAFAGIQAGRKLYDLRPLDAGEICARALAEFASALTAEGWHIEQQLPADLPPVLADAQALESALKNLLHNAQKYAADGRWLRVSATHTRNEVQITIADHGPGIAAADVKHLFEPFYRGQRVLASSVPGAGLGLSLVQRHLQAMGGRVTVKTAPTVPSLPSTTVTSETATLGSTTPTTSIVAVATGLSWSPSLTVISTSRSEVSGVSEVLRKETSASAAS